MKIGQKIFRKLAVIVLSAVLIALMCPISVMAAGNTYQTATQISLGTQYRGELTDSNTVDYYKFTLPKSGVLSIKAQAMVKYIYYDLYYGSDASEEVFSANPYWDSVSEVSNKTYEYNLTGGTYYFRVMRDGSSNNGSYNFKLTFTSSNESFTETGNGTNNSMATANTINLNTKYKGFLAYNDARDFYKFTMPVDGTVKVTLTAHMKYIYYYLYNSDGERLDDKNPYWDSVSQMSNNTYSYELTKGTYYVVAARDSQGVYELMVSSNAIPTLKINTQPKDYYGAVGSTAKFTVAAQGSGLKYQWQANTSGTWVNSSLTGAKTATLTVPVISSRDGYMFRCIVTDSYNNRVISNAVSLYVVPIQITSQPQNYSGSVGSTAKFTVAAQGSGLKYQWQTYSSGKWVNSSLTGAKTATLSVTISYPRDGYKFRCVITDSKNNTMISDAATLRVATPKLAITTQPNNYSGRVGTTARFRVVAQGSGLRYQWQTYRSGAWVNSTLTGCRTATLSVDVTYPRDGYKFRCVVTDSSNKQVISNTVTLRVT